MLELNTQTVDRLLEQPCYIIDFLSEQVPADSKGQYFKVENYLLNNFKRHRVYDRLVSVILKAMCYYHIAADWGGWHDQPAPAFIADAVDEIMDCHSGTLNLLFPEDDALMVFDWDCLHLSVYNPGEDMQRIMAGIAQSEGLFWRRANT